MGIAIGQKVIDFLRGKNRKNKDSILPTQEEKAQVISQYAKKYGCHNLIETGTYLGDTIEAMKSKFNRLYTIELSQELHEKACIRFQNDSHIKLYQGDSKDVLPIILKEIEENSLFWLDGHYSAGITAQGEKDTPILEELDAIYNAKKLNHVLLIDDARCFGVETDYPSMLELEQYILSKWENAIICVDTDIIRVVLNQQV